MFVTWAVAVAKGTSKQSIINQPDGCLYRLTKKHKLAGEDCLGPLQTPNTSVEATHVGPGCTYRAVHLGHLLWICISDGQTVDGKLGSWRLRKSRAPSFLYLRRRSDAVRGSITSRVFARERRDKDF